MRNAVFLAVPLAVAGCNSTPQNPVDASIVQAVVNQPITCQAGPDCETKWSRATAWIAQNAAYKVQTASDSIIQTMGPLPNDPRPSFTVTKAGDSTGTYTVSFNGGCDNFLGCIPPSRSPSSALSVLLTRARRRRCSRIKENRSGSNQSQFRKGRPRR
jgi:hypothetical protein